MNRDQLVAYLDDLLDSHTIDDVALNGLQVAGAENVQKIATAVSASAQFFADAAAWGADTVLVHHGLMWRGDEPPRLVGSARERVKLLLDHELNLIAYHLPLDRHPEHGNAAVMARALLLEQLTPFGTFSGLTLGFAGTLATPIPLSELAQAVKALCGQEPVVLAGGPDPVAGVGIVTGGAPAAFPEAVAAGLDVFITGEAREWIFYRAKEDRVSLIAAGHHATERFGVQALGEFLTARFDLTVRFFDYPNPA